MLHLSCCRCHDNHDAIEMAVGDEGAICPNCQQRDGALDAATAEARKLRGILGGVLITLNDYDAGHRAAFETIRRIDALISAVGE